jgi:hypothetical protein
MDNNSTPNGFATPFPTSKIEYFIDGKIVKCLKIPNKLSFKSYYIYDLTNNKEIKRYKHDKMTVEQMRAVGVKCEFVSRTITTQQLMEIKND